MTAPEGLWLRSPGKRSKVRHLSGLTTGSICKVADVGTPHERRVYNVECDLVSIVRKVGATAPHPVLALSELDEYRPCVCCLRLVQHRRDYLTRILETNEVRP